MAPPPPSTDPPSTDPPSTDPPSTDPPSTDPPSTGPPSTTCVDDRPLALEAEGGTSGAARRLRNAASGGQTVLLHDGQAVVLTFTVCEPTTVDLVVRYSNDNYDDQPSESVAALVDGQQVGSFVADDTGGGGAGWNVFSESTVRGVELDSGRHEVTITASGGDGEGVEIDAVSEPG